jgi:tRNA (mo5U34)-methyltransferase
MNENPSSLTRQVVSEMGPWFHNLHLPDGTQTAPDHFLGDFPSYKWDEIGKSLPEDLSGQQVLDIGCNAGFYCVEMARRGARVTGIDANAHYLAQAKWAADQFGLSDRISFQQMQVYDLVRMDRTFDIVLFLGVFYHLRYPLLGLDIVFPKVGRLMVFQTLMAPGEEVYEETPDLDLHDRAPLSHPGWPKMSFIEHRLSKDPTNWWAANRAGVEAMLRSSGFRVIGQPGREIYLCEPDPERPSCIHTWNAAEFISATGRSYPVQI